MTRGLQLPYTEYGVKEGESPNETFEATGATATRILDVSWDDRLECAAQLLGFPRLDTETDPSAPFITRYLPDYHPDFPAMIATKIISCKGIGARGYRDVNNGRIAKYLKARLVVNYELPNYDVLEDDEIDSEFDRYRTFEAKPAAEYLSVPQTGSQGLLTWSEGPRVGSPFPGNVGFIVGNIDYHWSWLQVPFDAIPEQAILNTIGRVNTYEFYGFPPGTLLLMAAEYKRMNSLLIAGNPFLPERLWQVDYTARYNPRLHNNFYDFLGAPGTGEDKGWYQASTTGVYFDPDSDPRPPNGLLLYDNADFFELFEPPAP